MDQEKKINGIKYLPFLIKDDELLEKNITKSELKSAILLKKDLTVNQYKTKNI